MITLPLQTGPPRWMEALVSSLLPPACREPVLGDLYERSLERGWRLSSLGYLGDAAATVPFVLRSQLGRIAKAMPVCSTARSGGLRGRAELLETQVWVRNASGLISSIFMAALFLLNAQGEWRFHETVSLAMTLGFIAAAWRAFGVLGRSNTVPPSLTHDELRLFLRRELSRQMRVGCREFVLGSLPAALLILYSFAITQPGFRGGVMLLAALGFQNCAIAWAQGQARRRYRRELDLLDREGAEA